MQQIKIKEQQTLMEKVSDQQQDIQFLRNVGYCSKTNNVLHQKSRILHKRQIVDPLEKVTDSQAWEPVQKGSIYQHFYTPNPERKPVKPFPKNMEKQLVQLERTNEEKLRKRDRIQDHHIRVKEDEQERKLIAEEKRRREFLKQA